MPGKDRCPRNRDLLKQVVAKLDEITRLSKEQAQARLDEEPERAAELDRELDLVYGEKERAVGAWQGHVREHGC